MVFPQFSHDIPSKVGISGGSPVTPGLARFRPSTAVPWPMTSWFPRRRHGKPRRRRRIYESSEKSWTKCHKALLLEMVYMVYGLLLSYIIWFIIIYHVLYDFISLLISSYFFDEFCAKSLAQNLGMLEGMIIYDNPASVDVEKQNKVLTHFYTCYLTNPSRYAGKRWDFVSFSTINLGEPISDGREMFRNPILRQMVERTQPCQFFNHKKEGLKLIVYWW